MDIVRDQERACGAAPKTRMFPPDRHLAPSPDPGTHRHEPRTFSGVAARATPRQILARGVAW